MYKLPIFKLEALKKEFPFLNHFIWWLANNSSDTNFKIVNDIFNYEIIIKKIDENILSSFPKNTEFQHNRCFFIKDILNPISDVNLAKINEICTQKFENYIEFIYLNPLLFDLDTYIVEKKDEECIGAINKIIIYKPNPNLDIDKLFQQEKRKAEKELEKENNTNEKIITNEFNSDKGLRQVVQFTDFNNNKMTGTIHAIKFNDCGKVTYDIGIWLKKLGNTETIIENVDSACVSPL